MKDLLILFQWVLVGTKPKTLTKTRPSLPQSLRARFFCTFAVLKGREMF